MVKISVPGKVHLIGEHAVVYNEPAIIAAVGKRISVEAKKINNVTVIDKEMDINREWPLQEVLDYGKKAQELWERGFEKKDFSEVFAHVKDNNFKKACIGFVLNKLEIDSGISLTISSEIPIGSGMGSSSALSVAIAKAISEVYGKGLSLEEVNSLAYELEKFKHGTPSGGDNSTCCFGGLIWFRKGNPNEIISLREEIPYKLENFVLVYTKKPEKTTGELVSIVRNLPEDFRNQRVKALGDATEKMKEALKKRDFSRMKGLINFAQKNLAELGVSIPEIDKIHERVVSIGGAAKLCGAGGGGTMLCYHEDKRRLITAIKELGFDPWEADLAVKGCSVEV